MRFKASLLLLPLTLIGCAHGLDWSWVPPEQAPKIISEDYADHDAVYLLVKERYMIVRRYGKEDYTDVQSHSILKVLTEKGFEQANIRIPYGEKDTFIQLAARTINPDGTITEVAPSRIFDEEASKEEKDGGSFRFRIFAFEDVKVGSKLEYVYTIRKPYPYLSFIHYIRDQLAIKEYQLEILGTPETRYSFRTYNSQARFTQGQEDGLWKISWKLQDLPKAPKESYIPRPYYRVPWWNYNAVQTGFNGVLQDFCTSWNTAIESETRSLYGEKYYKGFKPNIDFSDCGGERCKIQKALQHMRDKYPFRGYGSWPGRKAKKAQEAGAANTFEKNRILWYLLKQQNIKATFALTNRYQTRQLLEAAPTRSRLNHLLLWVPAQGDLKKGAWLDASCEYCALGEVPVWLAETEALLTEATTKEASTKVFAKTTFKKIDGPLNNKEGFLWRYQMELQPTGDAAVQASFEQHHRNSQDFVHTHEEYNEEQWKKKAQDAANERHSNNKLLKYTKTEKFEPNKSKHTVDFLAKGYATPDGERLIVPLTIFHSAWDKDFERNKRKLPIMFRAPYNTQEVLHIKLPAGLVAKALPPSKTFKSAGITVELKAERAGNLITVSRKISAKQGVYPVSEYRALREAVRAFAKHRLASIELEPAASAPSRPVARQNESKTGVAQ